MTDLFDEDELLDEDGFVNPDDEDVDMDAGESAVLDARRRLENMLEEKRLREELDDFMDY
ncbi:hypothetical protein Lqui_2897 [Legionella quinlivanii]|uniref:Uncharacterized protein n=1 Tax=Legionella quinlivanii TaxID=45073 RepID=A0A0W0XM42_9GAMM|nr:hypothetical protein [Legionella quinlivanii]KTD45426.1 hypothetical protein Lqui_2897 [Legionella quinlivanii]MCW8451286.1 hypothetical protein [Legionella quinlivanii]SEG33940.1 hypothetical protein SAMN02746093_02589 [Legionella quinlivanii DSM 21216]STY10517.1 Uncharacterised protein [Legionella quinlivanii]